MRRTTQEPSSCLTICEGNLLPCANVFGKTGRGSCDTGRGEEVTQRKRKRKRKHKHKQKQKQKVRCIPENVQTICHARKNTSKPYRGEPWCRIQTLALRDGASSCTAENVTIQWAKLVVWLTLRVRRYQTTQDKCRPTWLDVPASTVRVERHSAVRPRL